MSKCFVVILLLLSCFTASSQKHVAFDSAAIHVRNINTRQMDAYRLDPTFQYDRMLEPADSWWDRFWDFFWKKIADMLSTRVGRNSFFTIVILIAVAIVVFAVLRILGMNKAGLFASRNTSGKLPYSIHDENIHTIPFDEAIDQAVAQGNLRLAVRLLYLQTLKVLTDRQLISWEINKTNISYINELRGKSYREEFVRLTNQFENNWYGDHSIKLEEFPSVRESFHAFNRQIG